ncbi:MAG: putative quinol monooxygenase [Erysipelotrichaceae bacterium]
MNVLTIITTLNVKEDKTVYLKEALLKLIHDSLGQNGCLRYDLHQDNKDPNKFIIVEHWTGYDSWESNRGSEHMSEYVKMVDDSCLDWKIHELTKIS